MSDDAVIEAADEGFELAWRPVGGQALSDSCAARTSGVWSMSYRLMRGPA